MGISRLRLLGRVTPWQKSRRPFHVPDFFCIFVLRERATLVLPKQKKLPVVHTFSIGPPAFGLQSLTNKERVI